MNLAESNTEYNMVSSFEKKDRDLSNKDLQFLKSFQVTIPDPMQFPPVNFQVKNSYSTERREEVQLQDIQSSLQRLHSMHKYNMQK